MEYLVYRGQYGSKSNKIETRLPSITFSNLESAMQYAFSPNNSSDNVINSRVILAKVIINNPVINAKDCFADFDLLIEKLGEDFIWKMAEKYSEQIYLTDNWQNNYSKYKTINNLKVNNKNTIYDLYMNAYVLLDDNEFISKSLENGYDGAIHIGNGFTHDTLEYRVFNKNQIEIVKVLEIDAESDIDVIKKEFNKLTCNPSKMKIF